MTVPDDRHRAGLLTVMTAAPATVSGAAGLRPLGLGGRRDGLLFIPPDLDPAVPAPLVVTLHGAGGEASQMTRLLAAEAAPRGVVVLAPDSRGPSWDVIRGGFGVDIAFLERALERTLTGYRIDTARIAVSGFSDGASYALSIGVVNGGLFSDILAFSPGFLSASHQTPAGLRVPRHS